MAIRAADEGPQRDKKSMTRRIVQPLLMAVTILGCVTVLGATLRRRPAIEPPENVEGAYRSSGFDETLALANDQMIAMTDVVRGEVAQPADNLAIARRISLALVGSGLSLEEVRALSAVPEERQLHWWTSYLLNDPRWSDYFAERFSRAFVGTDEGPFILFRRRKFRMWLSEQFDEDVGYDQIVRSMIRSEGLWTDTPQVNFLTATIDPDGEPRPDPIRLTGKTSRAFLAQRIDCLQCHDDFLGELNFGTESDPVDGIQNHFHELAAFYGGATVGDPVFQGVRDDGEKYLYKYLGEDEESEIAPQVPFYGELLPTDGKPRHRLAAWVTHPENRAFARATVNRVWALLFSRPLVAPVDNIPLSDEVPEVLDTLADDFAQHGFKLRRLVRMIIETDAFQRASRADFEVTEEHENCWAVFPLTQLRPEQVAGSVFQASKLTALDESSSIFSQLKSFGDLQDFLKRFGDRGEDEFDSEAVTITQRLIMMNGNMVQERTKVDVVANAATRIAQLVPDNEKAIELVYLSSLNRRPSEAEMNAYRDYLTDKYGNTRARAVGDIYWAIINSTEFSWNH